jgi:hypothetical protein
LISSYSDIRLKKDIELIDNALEKVKSLRGVYFRPNDLAVSYGYEDIRHVGLIAQEVQAILPEVIRKAPIDGDYITILYANLVALLVESVKELAEKVENKSCACGCN